MLPIQKELSKLTLNKTQMDFDAKNLYPSGMWDENSVYPKVGSGYTFRPQMNGMFVTDFNNETFHQDGNDSRISKIKYYNPPNFVFQHLLVKEKHEKIEVKRVRNGYIIDTLT